MVDTPAWTPVDPCSYYESESFMYDAGFIISCDCQFIPPYFGSLY